MVSIAIMGHGVVGSGVAEIFTTHKQKLYASIGEEVYVKKILDLREFPDSPLADRFTKNFEDIINDLEIRVVVEVMGGLNPAYDFVKRCLKAGKSVVTSNKELVAAHGAELLEISKETNTNFLFEASVGGGIPIIRPMSQCLVANNVDEIAGILNGTTNFILTKMIEDGMTFEEALKLAQDNGYAEKDPTADIEGFDACRKVCILASLAFGKHVYPNQVRAEGITKITLEDVSYISSADGVIKLLGQIKKIDDDSIAAFVSPAVVFNGSQLASVNGVFNAILVRGDAVGDVCFYGPGAGKLPTASAVVADMVDCAVHVEKRKTFGWGEGAEDYVVDEKAVLEMPFYVRAKASCNDALSRFSDVKFLNRKGQPSDEIAFITDSMTENELMSKLEGIDVINIIKVTNY